MRWNRTLLQLPLAGAVLFALGSPARAEPEPLVITDAELRTAVEGADFVDCFRAGGGTAPYQWSIEGELPAGLLLDPATGALTGKVGDGAAVGKATIRVSDSSSPPQTAEAAFELDVALPKTVAEPAEITCAFRWEYSGVKQVSTGREAADQRRTLAMIGIAGTDKG